MSNLPTTNPPSFAQQLKKLLSILGRAITRPVVEEWPFILLLTILSGASVNFWINPFSFDYVKQDPFILHWCRNFTIAYLIGYIVTIAPSSALKWCIRIIFISIFSTILLIIITAKTIFNIHLFSVILTLFAETNKNEVLTVIDIVTSSYGFYTTLARLTILIVIFLLLNKYKTYRSDKISFSQRCISSNIRYYISSILIFSILITGLINSIVTFNFVRIKQYTSLDWDWRFHNQQNVDILLMTATALKAYYLQYDEIQSWTKSQSEFYQHGYANSHASDSLKVVGIIGESLILSHLSCYGYSLNTTPKINAEIAKSNAIFARDITCYDNHTSSSLKSFFSLNRRASDSDHSLFFPLCFKKSGFKVMYYDNQHIGQGNSDNSLFSQICHPEIIRICYDEFYNKNDNLFDLEFVETVTPGKAAPEGRELTFYHLRGSHLWAEYPREPKWVRFSPIDVPNKKERPWLNADKLQRIADYDNSVYYNDSVVAKIIDRYRYCEAVVVYFSDHGEEIYDYRDNALRTGPEKGREREWKEAMFHVPFFIWMSDFYIQRNPLQAQAIREAADRPGMLSRIAHTFLRLGEIETPVYDHTADILSPHYTPRPRITINGYNYDE